MNGVKKSVYAIARAFSDGELENKFVFSDEY